MRHSPNYFARHFVGGNLPWCATSAYISPSAGTTFDVWCKRIQHYQGRVVISPAEVLGIFARHEFLLRVVVVQDDLGTAKFS